MHSSLSLLFIGIEGFSPGISIQGIKLTSEDEDLVLRLRMSGFVDFFWLNILELYLCSLYIPSWHGHLYNCTFFMGLAISFYVAFTQNNFGSLQCIINFC